MQRTRLTNRAAIVSKEYRQQNFFGSHIGMPNASQSNGLQHLNAEITSCSIQSLFRDQCLKCILGRLILSPWENEEEPVGSN